MDKPKVRPSQIKTKKSRVVGSSSYPPTARKTNPDELVTLKKKKSKIHQKTKSMITDLDGGDAPVLDPVPVDSEILDAETENALRENLEKELNEKVAFTICQDVVEGLWDTIWDICHSRFVHENASELIVSELRDTWLAIMIEGWMDSDPVVSSGISLPEYEVDGPPLPPKFDFWSHGALEVLPNNCRESIMDPFLRSPLPWLANYNEYRGEDIGSDEESPTEDGSVIEEDSTRNLIRPKSPVPTEYSEDTWSTASTIGSNTHNNVELNEEGVKLDSWHSSLMDAPNSSVMSAQNPLNPENSAPLLSSKKSLEVLYQNRFAVEIKGSSEISYRMNEFKGERIAFRLPNHTSSESVRILLEENQKHAVESDADATETRSNNNNQSITESK